MSHLIHWDVPNTIKDILRDTFGINGNIVNIQLLFSVDKTDSSFALTDFCNKEECTPVMNKIYKIDNGNKSLNTEMVNNNTNYLHCKNTIQEYEQTSNLDIVNYLLIGDQKSIMHIRHKKFIKTTSLKALYDDHPILTTKRNLILVRIFPRKIISLTAYTHRTNYGINKWMNNNEVKFNIKLHTFFLALILSKCAISSKVETLINTFVHFHHDFSFVVNFELLQSILKSIQIEDLQLMIAKSIDIVLNNVTPKTLPFLIPFFEMLAFKSNALQIFIDANFDQEIFDLQQNNQNTMILPSVRSNPELIDERKNYKMNVLVEKSITLNKPKNQEDCNNYQKNENTLHDFSQTATPLKAISSQTVNKLVEKVPRSSMSSNAKASSQIVQKPVKRFSSSTENNGQSSINKKNNVIGSGSVQQTINKITDGVPMCLANIILKKLQLTIYAEEWKIKKQLLIPCESDRNSCLEKLDMMMSNLQLSSPLMNNSSKLSINILSKSTLPNCHRRKKDTINNIFIDEKTYKQLIMSEKNRYKKSINISIAGGTKVQRGKLSDEDIHKHCLAAVEQLRAQILTETLIQLIVKKPSNFLRIDQEILVVSLMFVGMRKACTSRNEIGNIFTTLLSDKLISVPIFTKGINRVFRNQNDFLLNDIRIYLFAEICVPLLISNCFEFSNVMDCMLDVNKTECLITFIEILNEIDNLKEHDNIKEYNGVVPWTCNKWNKSKHIESFIDFVSNTNLSLYFLSNGLDQTAILILSMAMHDVIRGSQNKMYVILTSWVKANLDIHVIGHSCFTRAIAIAVILVIINDNEFDGTFDNFFQNVHIMIFKYYVAARQWRIFSDIQERELHCLYGIQTVCAALKYPESMLFKLFNKLYECQIISYKSFLLWKNDEMCTSFPGDHETKSMAVSLSSSFFQLLDQKNFENKKSSNI